MNRYVCIHGHFYQPPRENPWLEEIERQDSAYPYHDWNERITAECYGPNAGSHILDAEHKITDIVNNYSRISFNFGPTLLFWLEKHTPEIYKAILDADRESRKRCSDHGSALAQVYNHMIMPLANARDKETQVIWGIKDFQHRFGRKPEGMWLAETAVDIETLEVLARHSISFTILAPGQASRVRKINLKKWKDVSGARIDPRMPYLCRLPSGKTISLFFYDGPISQDIAFGGMLSSGETFANRLLGVLSGDGDQAQLVHIATDGESYGHHHRFGEMALSYCLHHIESNDLAQITVYGEFLEKFPPTHEVEIIENSSWSCVHGIERWRSDCGCNSGRAGWNQKWRAPLRIALDWLRDELIKIYEKEMARYMRDPWQARDAYLDVILDRGLENVARFFEEQVSHPLSKDEKVEVYRLLEMQRHALLMYTSCGWFFDEISGIETTQVLQYAARAIQLGEMVSGAKLEETFLEMIERAPSNLPELGNGAEVYRRYVKPAIIDLLRVGAHYAVSSLFEPYPESVTIYSYKIDRERYDLKEAGRQRMALGQLHMRSNVTEEEESVTFGVLHLGDHNLLGGVREFVDEESFVVMEREMNEAFNRSDVPEMIHLIDKHFGAHNYSLWHLFRDEQRRVFNRILETTLQDIGSSFRQIYHHHYPIMQVMRELQTPIPKALSTTAEFTINADLQRALENGRPDLNELKRLVGEVQKWKFDVDRTTLSFIASRKINSLMVEFSNSPMDVALLGVIDGMFTTLEPMSLQLDLWQAQKNLFLVNRGTFGLVMKKVEGGDRDAIRWMEHFESLGDHLRVRVG